MLVGLTPFIEQQSLWEQISNPFSTAAQGGTPIIYPAMGPVPRNSGLTSGDSDRYGPWHTELPTLRCPSDPGVGLPSHGRTNYAACLGDSPYRGTAGSTDAGLNHPSGLAQQTRASMRGAFVPREVKRFRDILDGLANTIVMGEITTDLGDRDVRTLPVIDLDLTTPANVFPTACSQHAGINASRPQFWSATATTTGAPNARGYRWASGFPVFTVVNTILPPNDPVCTSAAAEDDTTGGGTSVTGFNSRHGTGFLPPSSRHQGGCHVLMGDGAVKFITDSIEAGNQNQTPVHFTGTGLAVPGAPSSYGLWGTLGTRASKEVINKEF
jgi:prepilin-type processing-associated H-X9-DG protein